jgi:hypothetical protein
LETYKKSLKDRLPSKLYDFSSAQNEQNDDFFTYLESIEDWEEAVDKIVYVEKCKLPGFLIYVEW